MPELFDDAHARCWVRCNDKILLSHMSLCISHHESALPLLVVISMVFAQAS